MKWKSPEEWEALKQGTDCPMCADMHLDENRFSYKVAELQQGIVRLAKNQYMRGYTLVILKRHANELFELTPEELTGYWQDVAAVAKVLNDMYRPTKINYLIYGHHMPHIHCHLLVHSYDDDPSKPVDMNEETVLLSSEDYEQVVSEMRERLRAGAPNAGDNVPDGVG